MSQDGFITDVGHVFNHKIIILTVNKFFFALWNWDCSAVTLIYALIDKLYAFDKVDKRLPCGMQGREERCIQGFGGETWEKEKTWKSED